MVYSDSQPQAQVYCSATSLEESRESTPSASTIVKKYESDIEVLSNPSQSSIEVLDDSSKSASTPNRKRSSEERRIAIAPTLLTIPDTTPIMAGLTESSSSDSLTDSICTAYETKHLQTPAISRNSSSNHSIEENEKNITGVDSDNITTTASNLTSILGGLLQSMKIGTNKGAPVELNDGSDSLTSNIQYSYTDFRNIDHRIKLYLILNVFEQENEKLVLLLRTEILIQNQLNTFPGCLVLSTSKVYILKIIGAEGDDPQDWLRKEISWPMDRLRTIASLPFKQGVVIQVQQPNKIGEGTSNFYFLCILQDLQRTSNFLFYLTELPLPTSCKVEFAISKSYTSSIHSLMALSKYQKDITDGIRILALFSSAKLKFDSRDTHLNIGGLIITTSALILTQDKIHWLLPESKHMPIILTEQGISNLIEVIFHGDSLALNFLDEVEGIEESWNLKFVSLNAVEAVINAIQSPWEELFSVPLQITNATEQKLKEKS